MTKEITKAILLQQIQDKFKLRELEPEIFAFSERVIPIYDIGQHLESWVVKWLSLSITAGPAAYEYWTVPADEKWTLRGYNVVFMATGAYKVTGLFITRLKGAAYVIYADMVKGQTASYSVNLPVPITLVPGESISLYVDDYTSTADLRLYIDHSVEEIR